MIIPKLGYYQLMNWLKGLPSFTKDGSLFSCTDRGVTFVGNVTKQCITFIRRDGTEYTVYAKKDVVNRIISNE